MHRRLITDRVFLFLSFCLVAGCSSPVTDDVALSHTECSDGNFSLRADFEGGNMGRCEVIADAAFRLYLSPEDQPINDSPWYAFKVGGGPGQLSIELRYALHSHRYPPKLSQDAHVWRVLEEERVVANEDGTVVTLSVEVEGAPLWIAGQELMVQSDYEAWMSGLVQQHGAVLSTIGRSAGGRPIYLLESAEGELPQRNTVVLLGRAHPPEVTGALALRYFVDRLFDEHQPFLTTHRLFVVPLLNPDGVALGYWRHGLGGIDLNRDWGHFTQPETDTVLKAIDQRIAEGMRPRLMLDFHSTHQNVFYTQTDAEDAQTGNFTRQWFAQARALGVYPFEHARRHNEGTPTSKNYFHTRFGIPAITFELGDHTPHDEIMGSSRKFADAMVAVLEDRRNNKTGFAR